jgi:5-methylcytosine-specific restriction endonuclease McrA
MRILLEPPTRPTVTLDKIQPGTVFYCTGRGDYYRPHLKLQENQVVNLVTNRLWTGHTSETEIRDYSEVKDAIITIESINRDSFSMVSRIPTCPNCGAFLQFPETENCTEKKD